MKRHRHHHKSHQFDFFSNLSIDMAVYLVYPAFQVWKSIMSTENDRSRIIILLVFDAIITCLLWLGVLPTIYQRNKDQHSDRSRSGIVLIIIAITLVITMIKDGVCLKL